ncbi:hypothetical protein BANRA_05528 [Klebsiella pneumoniae]|nr:hypothetical protein BANRA_05528 [Klebsiella pneumoniae]
MIPSSSALVSLKPARQAALQAIMTVEEARQRGARLPSMPHVRTFLRLLTGCSRINSDVARRIPGIHRDPKDRLSSLKQVEEALDMLISSHGEYCPLPLTMDVQAENFPEVLHTRTVRRLKRQDFAFTRKCAVKPVRSSSPVTASEPAGTGCHRTEFSVTGNRLHLVHPVERRV